MKRVYLWPQDLLVTGGLNQLVLSVFELGVALDWF
jgi:hypothetical protein